MFLVEATNWNTTSSAKILARRLVYHQVTIASLPPKGWGFNFVDNLLSTTARVKRFARGTMSLGTCASPKQRLFMRSAARSVVVFYRVRLTGLVSL